MPDEDYTAAARPQRGRTTSNCTCDAPCFYCRAEQIGSHDHDHFPLPYRLGGRTTVAACRRCHSLKDRVPLARWAPAALEAAATGMGVKAAFVLAACKAITIDGPSDFVFADTSHEAAAVIEAAVTDCSTAEARIAIAQVCAQALDVERKRRKESA